MISPFVSMHQPVLALSLLFVLASCEKTEPKKTSEIPQPVQAAPVADSTPKKEIPARIDTPEELNKLQGKLPRLDPEKAKFIAVPSTPPDPKQVTASKPAETIVKAVPKGPKESLSSPEKKQDEPSKTK